ncbi:MAG: pentapeptide repeat-containing protein [Candidatus Shapirobacteria bacterium]|jgi:hypothetical protein
MSINNIGKNVTIFYFGLILGIITTAFPIFIKNVLAVRPIRTDSVNYYGGFYKDLNSARLTGNGDGIFLAYHDFTGFNFTDADMGYDNLVETKFINANLTRTNFTGADLTNAYFSGATNLDTTKWYSCPADGQCGETTCPDGSKLTTMGSSCVGHLLL